MRARASSHRSSSWIVVALALGACGGAPARSEGPRPTPASARTAAQPAPSGFTIEGLARGAILFDDLGTHHRSITTSSPEAQAFFDQGLRLGYGFNHDEAARSYARAAELDPSCALCFWGIAYMLGPNYNIPLLPDRARASWEAIERAGALSDRASEVERALIAALAHRVPGPEYLDPAHMQPYAEQYAQAMREVAQRFPDDDDVQVLAAEAAMNVSPWRLWSLDGEPAPGTEEIVRTLETVLARSPRHPGANHFYIHAVEASRDPGRAIPSAERLPGLMPGAGHVVHMPAHIFQRVGRYADASEANRRAIDVDRRYLDRVTPPGYYPMYLGHNYGFLAYSSAMEGRRAESLEAARQSARTAPRDIVCSMPGMDFFLSEPLLVMVRFGMWDELLDEPAPEERYPVLAALYHHARGMALASRDRPDEARAELAAIAEISAQIPEEMLAGLNTGRTVLELAAAVLEARIAESTGASDAIDRWQHAVALEDRLAYNEPADWFYSTRPFLGAALLDARRPRDAEAVFRADLERHPENGWALFGLARALRDQRRARDAEAAEVRFRLAWAHADVTLDRAAF